MGTACCRAALLTCAGCCQRRRRSGGSLPARLALQSQLPPQLRVRPACQPTALLLIICSSTPDSQGPSTVGQLRESRNAADTACCQTRSDIVTMEPLHGTFSCSSCDWSARPLLFTQYPSKESEFCDYSLAWQVHLPPGRARGGAHDGRRGCGRRADPGVHQPGPAPSSVRGSDLLTLTL